MNLTTLTSVLLSLVPLCACSTGKSESTAGITEQERIPDNTVGTSRENPITRLSVAGIDDPLEVQLFLAGLQVATSQNDRNAIAKMVRYPFVAYGGFRPILYERPAEFVRDFDRLFTPRVIQSIRRAEFGSLFVNYRGVMIGNGEIWFDQREDGLKIIAVNGYR